MTFLAEPRCKKVLRTVLYGDQEFSRFELEIVHTPVFQRLYNLKQLGFADKVFPDAIHSRFNHLLGVCEVVSEMSRHLAAWLDRNQEMKFSFWEEDAVSVVAAPELSRVFKDRIASLRLMALLHDLTHAAFGHTLEDEVRVFPEKHDEPSRQVRFFDGLVAQLIYIWRFDGGLTDVNPTTLKGLARLEFDRDEVLAWVEEIWAHVSEDDRDELVADLAALEYAIRLLLYLDLAHEQARELPPEPSLLLSSIMETIGGAGRSLGLIFHRDLFMIDIVGNTMCADLLDYARRDPEMPG